MRTSHQFIGYEVMKPQAMASCIMNQNSMWLGGMRPIYAQP